MVSVGQMKDTTACTYSSTSDLGLVILCGGDMSLAPILIRAELRAGALEGTFNIATNESGELLGYIVTMPPGINLFGS